MKINGLKAIQRGGLIFFLGSGALVAQVKQPVVPTLASPDLISSTAVAAMDQVGSMQGEFRVTETGNANYSIPIELPAGTAGVKPGLGLSYSSSGGNHLVGQGWSLNGLSSISLCRQTLHQDGDAKPITYSASDRYCLDGQRLIQVDPNTFEPLTGGQYGAPGSVYKTEIDSFVKVTAMGVNIPGADLLPAQPDFFIIEGKDGSTKIYGELGTSDLNDSEEAPRLENGAETTYTRTWALSEFQDSVGNQILYTYEDDTEGHRISQIEYGFGAGVIAQAKVEFEYEDRLNATVGYSGYGSVSHKSRLTKRLKTIKSFNTNQVNLELAREWRLSYLPSSPDRVSSIKICSRENACVPATNFDWAPARASGFSSTASTVVSIATQGDRRADSPQFTDINGDGRLDLAWLEPDRDPDDDDEVHDQYWQYILAQANGLYSNKLTAFEHSGNQRNPDKWAMIDYNADGRSDLATHYRGRWRIRLSRPQFDGSWKIAGELIDTGISNKDTVFTDINADGLVDAIYGHSNTEIAIAKLEVAPGRLTTSDNYYRFDPSPTILSVGTSTETIKVLTTTGSVDFNADGKSDFLIEEKNSTHYVEKAMVADTNDDGQLELFHSFTRENVGSTSKNTVDSWHEVWADVNGDGLVDLITAKPRNTAGSAYQLWWAIQLNVGHSFASPIYFQDAGVATSKEYPRAEVSYRSPTVIDFNGDGVMDFVWRDHNGVGTLRRKAWQPELEAFSQNAITVRNNVGTGKYSDLFSDVNGDGTLDFVAFKHGGTTSVRVYKGLGAGGAENVITKITNGYGAKTELTYQSMSTSAHYAHLNVDLSGAKKTACSSVASASFCEGSFHSSVSNFYNDVNGDWSAPQGGVFSHSFGRDTNQDGVHDPVLQFLAPMFIVTSVQSSSPSGTSNGSTRNVNSDAMSKVSYFYSEAKLQAMGRGFLGFEKLMTRDEQSGVETTTWYRQDFPFNGQAVRTEVRSPSDEVLRESTSDWRLQDWNGSSHYAKKYFQVHNYRTTDKTYDLNDNGASAGSLITEVTSTFDMPDVYGNIPKITVTTSGGGQNFEKVTFNTYEDTDWGKEKGRLIRADVLHKRDTTGNGIYDSVVTRSASFTYFAQGVMGGLLQTETIEPDDVNLSLVTAYVYDVFGNKIGASSAGLGGARCTENLAEYDAYGRYATTQRDCLGRKVSEVMERNIYGSPTIVRNYLDVLGLAYIDTHTAYTPLGQVYFEADNTGAFGGTTLEACDASCPADAVTVKTSWGPGDGSPQIVALAKVYFDVLGRSIRTQKRNFNGSWIYQDKEYDSLGRVRRTSVPDTDTIMNWTTMSYDLLGRTVSALKPDGSNFTTAYSGYQTISTNALNQTKTEVVNALGEKVEVKDHLGSRVTFGYDAQGNLTNTTSYGVGSSTAISIQLEYDLLGRKISMSDPDKGNWTYAYNSFGDLIQQTNANGHSSLMTYDPIGRMLTRTDVLASGVVEGQTQWVYDATLFGLGKVASVTDLVSGYVKLMQYDNLGRLSETVTSLGVTGVLGDHFEKVTYDQYGRTFQVFDAARNLPAYGSTGVETRYNSYGYAYQWVSANYAGGSPAQIYRTITAMDARGNITAETLGNGVNRTATYDPLTGRLTNLKGVSTQHNNRKVQDLALSWDEIGNLKHRYEYGYGASIFSRQDKETYTYDGLNRLTKTIFETGSALTGTQSLSYDSLGNITYKSGVGSYAYGGCASCGPHAVKSAGATQYQYDANGNMISDTSGRTIEYSSFDKAVRLSKGSNTTSFRYGPDRKRYYRQDITSEGTKTTLYIGSVEKITNTDGSIEWKRYIGDSVIVTAKVNFLGLVTSTERHYLIKDHLGSVNLIMNEGGAVAQVLNFDPWGKRATARQNEGTTPWHFNQTELLLTTKGFTGHEMVDGLDVVHMNGRIYDAGLARFLQADPFIDGEYNTQGYNRYSYGKNNPLGGIDPSGFGFFSEVFDDFLGITESPILNGVAQIAACYFGGPWGCAAYATASARGHGAEWGQAIKAGAIAYVSAKAFSGLEGLQAGEAFVGGGLIGGLSSVAQGGKFGHGFISAGIGAGFGASGLFNGNLLAKTAASAVIGGTSSKITGGKFVNGAATAAFAAIVSSVAEKASRSDVDKALDHLDGSEAFQKEYAYARKHGTKISALESGGSYFDPDTNTVYWNPTDGSDIAAGISSPASTLAHEISHAAQFHRVGASAFDASLQAPVLNVNQTVSPNGIQSTRVSYGVSVEERRATVFERTVQRQIGEPLRANYRDSASFTTNSPTFYCHAGSAGCQ